MKIKLLLFAQLRDEFNAEQLTLEVTSTTTVGQIVKDLLVDRPGLSGLPIRCAVNESFVGDHHNVIDGDRVALIPPVSGG